MKTLHKQWLQFLRLLFNEHFINALRCTSLIIVPVIVLVTKGLITTGVYMGLGTLLVSLTDIPGSAINRLKFLTLSSIILSLVALLTALLSSSFGLTVMLMAVFCFVFSMLTAFGGNLNAIGSLALIMMVFTIGLKPADAFSFTWPVVCGCVWYTIGTGIDIYLFPNRSVNYALSECIIAMSYFLRKKAKFYDANILISDIYKDVIPGHLSVSEKQETLRTMLLSSHDVFNQNSQSEKLIKLTAEVIDLYEQISAIHYDYEFVRKTLHEHNLLPQVKELIENIADELYFTGVSLHSAGHKKQFVSIDHPVLARLIQVAETADTQIAGLVTALSENFKQICNKLTLINELATVGNLLSTGMESKDVMRFSNRSQINFSLLKTHLNYHSPVFRFALRLTAACLFAYILMLFVLPGKYSYWLLLTIVIIAKPGFSVTKKRNMQRIGGSLLGVCVAYTFLKLGLTLNLQLVLIAVFLAGYIGFLYVNYSVSVVFITVVAIFGLHILGGSNDSLLAQRSYTVLLGGGITLIAAFLLPSWERKRIKNLMRNTLLSNINLLEDLVDLIKLKSVNIIEYKLKRKQVFVDTADLFKSFEQLQSEPQSNSFDVDLFYRFQIFNHDLYASISSLFHFQLNYNQVYSSPEVVNSLECSLTYLKSGLSLISGGKELLIDANIHPDVKSYCSENHFRVHKHLEVLTNRAMEIHSQMKTMYTL